METRENFEIESKKIEFNVAEPIDMSVAGEGMIVDMNVTDDLPF